ncbi:MULTISPECIES: ABC transporter substrate-binding protein [unclassified Sphingomonas]|uniref:ABC transporter substrate-binding protein n=1 Tax=unclassified Sphingomonas TaxID=196159 RepID=UPI0009EC4963|nr:MULTISPECIES: ABC transporter substrate-binding protein [unclassified Sphingomonas]
MRLRNLSRLLSGLVLALAAGLAGPASAAPPRRIVSLSVCADQYLLMLADPGQIAALNRFSHDPAMSWAVEKARRFPAVRGSAEEMLTLEPDLVFTSGFGTPAALAVLRSRKVRMVDIGWADSFESIERTTRTIAAEIGHPARGEALIAAMRARLKALGPAPGRGRVAAYYQRRGYLTGQGTLIDEMMRRAGLANLATRLGRPMLSRLSLEEMAVARPDFLLVENGEVIRDKGTEMLQHPLLKRTVPARRRIILPEALTTCGGPSYPDAMATLFGGIRGADK